MCVNGDTGVDPREVYRDTHLDADKALNCGVALAYFIKAFAALTPEERADWLNVHNDEYRYELGSLMMSWGAGGEMVFHLALTAAGVEGEAIEATLSALNDSLRGTPFTDAAFRDSYDIHLSEPLARMQIEDRNSSDDDDDDDVDAQFDELMAMLRQLVAEDDDRTGYAA